MGLAADLAEIERDNIQLLRDRLSDEIAADRRHLTSGPPAGAAAAPEGGREDGAPGLLLSLAWETREFAACRFLIDGNVEAFRRALTDPIGYYRRVIERAAARDPLAIAWLVPRDAREAVLLALAAGDRHLAQDLAAAARTLTFPNQARRRAGMAGITALHAVLSEGETGAAVKGLSEALKDEPTRGPDDVLFQRYVVALTAGDAAKTSQVIDDVARLFLSGGTGPKIPRDMGVAPYLSPTAVGLGNLARLEGLAVEPRDPRVPPVLLLPYSRRKAQKRQGMA